MPDRRTTINRDVRSPSELQFELGSLPQATVAVIHSIVQYHAVSIYSDDPNVVTNKAPDYDAATDAVVCNRDGIDVYVIIGGDNDITQTQEEPADARINRKPRPLEALQWYVYDDKDVVAVISKDKPVQLFSQNKAGVRDVPQESRYKEKIYDGVVCTDGNGNWFLCAT